MAVTNEDVEAAKERVARLREQVAQENAKRVERENGLQNEIDLKRLEREEADLEAQLAVAKDRNKAATVKEASPLPSVSEAAKTAQADAKVVTDAAASGK